ncbi:hypothetical protein R84B8_02114 [Treponema sp. R8-4-B8]
MLNKDKYIEFCTEHSDIPIFSQPWWLDAVCPDSWDVILIERNNKIIASFPYYKTKIKKIFSHIGMPPLTQKLGPYIVYDSNKKTENKIIEYEHEIYYEIIDKLPKCDSLKINFDWKYKNWLPFYWKGFKQTTRYTYILNQINNHDYIFKNFERTKREKIKKAKQSLKLKFDLSPEAFYDYFSDVIHKRGEKVSFSKELFQRIYNAVYTHQTGRAFYCTDSNDDIHAIKLILWDKECAYSIMGMREKNFNTSGGNEFLIYEIIKYVSQFVNRFDFEGSMIKGVEASYRYFGSHQTEYYSISKCDNLILRVLRTIKNN